MVDADGSGGVRKCSGMVLADLGDVEGVDRSREDPLYPFQLSDGAYKRKHVAKERIWSLKFELCDVANSLAVQRRPHRLAFIGRKRVSFADPVQQIGWLIDFKISFPYVVTRKDDKVRKVANCGTQLCSYIPETKDVVAQEAPDRSSYVPIDLYTPRRPDVFA